VGDLLKNDIGATRNFFTRLAFFDKKDYYKKSKTFRLKFANKKLAFQASVG